MQPLVTREEMQALDRRTIAEVGVPGAVLMESAGRAVADAVLARVGRRPGVQVAIVCGPGNNGGDGYVAARALEGSPFARPTVYRAAARDRVSGDAAIHLGALERSTVPIVDIASAARLEDAWPALEEAEVVVDAVLGIGVSAPVTGHLLDVLTTLAALPGELIAVDLPSGMDADRGSFHGPPLDAVETVTMAFAKLGMVGDPGFLHCGRVTIADIGIRAPADVRAALFDAVAARTRLPVRSPAAHKGSAGHLLVVAGSPGKTGAALLAARAASRAGAGLVTVAAPTAARDALDRRVVEVMTADLGPVAETADVARFLALAAERSAVAIGPGMPTGAGGAELVRAAVEELSIPVVLDADALNHLARDLGSLERAQGPRLLTPHPGEMARLTGLDVQAVQADRAGVARSFAQRHGVYLALKGARTVVASPDGFLTINPTGNPGLASGGTGDVLTGIVGALLAQQVAPGDALRLGVYLHGAAADRVVAARGGETLGLIASDLIRALPRSIGALRAGS